MCLVEVSGPRGATLQPACYVAVADGMDVVTTSEKVKKAQDGVLEMLLVNHPLDCPVCDKGGECPLQDQVLAYGPGESRFLEEKRHWAKPIPISELVMLDRERCIQCGRCVRFANEIAGEAQIDFLGRGDTVEVNVFEGAAFSSYFAGNTVQICPGRGAHGHPLPVHGPALGPGPGGVDLHALCLRLPGRRPELGQPDHAAAGDGLRPGQPVVVVRQGSLRGRGPERRQPGDRAAHPAGREPASRPPGAKPWPWWRPSCRRPKRQDGSASIGLLGGARLSNEDAYAWAKLAKGVIGTDSVDAQIGDGLPAEVVVSLPRATIDEACTGQVPGRPGRGSPGGAAGALPPGARRRGRPERAPDRAGPPGRIAQPRGHRQPALPTGRGRDRGPGPDRRGRRRRQHHRRRHRQPAAKFGR